MEFKELQKAVFDAVDNIEVTSCNFDPEEEAEEEEFIEETNRYIEMIEEYLEQIREPLRRREAEEAARHKAWLKEAEKELEGLPELAYTLIITGRKNGVTVGNAAIVKKGVSGYYPTDWPSDVYTQEYIDEMNRRLGLTEEQAEKLVEQSFWKR